MIEPGQTIGILGAGQLGRMLAAAAARLGLKAHVFAPPGDNPAIDVAASHTLAAYEDEEALARFGDSVALVTYEFENVPAATAAALARRAPVLPGPDALATTQDRLAEKTFLKELGVAAAPFIAVDDAGALARAVATLGRPAILKTRRLGYDGKGQALIREGADIGAVFRGMRGAPAILEGFVDFSREISVVAARGADGAFASWDVCENAHEQHILARTTVPARVRPETAGYATGLARAIADALGYVGVLAVEMFVVGEGEAETVLVNEIAPRVHNSGHWTIEGADTSQFEQHIRAICGWPLGSTRRRGTIEMENLVGDAAGDWRAILGEPGASLHLYGKARIRAGRKMGHVTRVRPETPP